MTLIGFPSSLKQFEEVFNVTAAARLPFAAAGAPAGGGEAAAEEKDEFDVILEDVEAKKIQVIKGSSRTDQPRSRRSQGARREREADPGEGQQGRC